MEAVKKEITIPKNHHLTVELDVPPSIPTGKAEVLLIFQPVSDEPQKRPRPVFGCAKGLIEIPEDFDDLLDDFAAYV
jgi:hypothetical protein